MREAPMLLGPYEDDVERLMRALGTAFEPVAAELRLVDVGDFISFIHDEKFANIQDIVNSSVELFFKPGTVSFGCVAEFELDWNRIPVIALDLEFRHGLVWIVFRLILRGPKTDVMIKYFSPGRAFGSSRRYMADLIEAIDEARLATHEYWSLEPPK